MLPHPGHTIVESKRRFARMEQMRLREEQLRKLAPGRMTVDPDTGEVLEGPKKTSKSTYRITLAK